MMSQMTGIVSGVHAPTITPSPHSPRSPSPVLEGTWPTLTTECPPLRGDEPSASTSKELGVAIYDERMFISAMGAPFSSPSAYPTSPTTRPKTLYATVPLPAMTPSEVLLHPMLEKGPALSLLWDIRTPWQEANLPEQHGDRQNDCWSQAATLPAVESLTIRCAVIERPVVVFPLSLNASVVTVSDVLEAIHRAYRAEHVDRHDDRPFSVLSAHADGTLRHGSRGGIATRAQTSTAAAVDVYGWRWEGLKPSPIEREVWTLMLY